MIMAPPSSQSVPMPQDLPFKVISGTIGTGAYAFIRKAHPLNAPKPIIAVKFINKGHAFDSGRLRPKQLQTEIVLHKHLGRQKNIIEFYSSGEDPAWKWIAMELAEGGDLFDKIEADAGVGEDIAHFYFSQLISAISYMHSKGVAHRDIKPENVLVSGDGNLKLADFGLATLFQHEGKRRLCSGLVGSPPYIAPEIVTVRKNKPGERETGYDPTNSDIWSCGIVLFVLLVGNTPWDEPTGRSLEFKEYMDLNGRANPADELWMKIPPRILSLLHGMLKLQPKSRFTLNEVRTHPWFTRPNPHLSASGSAADPINLATQMMQSLRIDFSAPAPASARSYQPVHQSSDAMDVDMEKDHFIASTQPITPMAEMQFDFEPPPRMAAHEGISASQPAAAAESHHHQMHSYGGSQVSSRFMDHLAEDISMSQFTATPSVPLSLTQAAKRFGDIVPSYTLSRFLSTLPLSLLVPLLIEALHRLGVPSTPTQTKDSAYIQVVMNDGRGQSLKGTVIVEKYNHDVLEVRFVKAKGDPLEWRRIFKKICVLCKDAILVP